jgi:RNA polymerase sigma-70 factor (sigma-E family)
MQANVERARLEGGRFEDLYVRHASAAGRLAYLLTGDREVAEDLVHDAFVRLAGRLLRVTTPGGVPAYLRVTVVNLARSYHRRRAVEARFARRAHVEDEASPPADPTDRDELRRALLRLGPRQRTAIVLRFYEDLSEADTAVVMRCSRGTVKSLVSRGLDRLRPLITEPEP